MSRCLSREERVKRNYELRERFWESVGEVDKDVLAFLVNPAFMGQPQWPDLRQAYKKIVTKDSVILSTDGLSDEFSDSEKPNNGFGIELYLELNDPVFRNMSIQELGKTWAFELLYQATLNAANSGTYRAAAEKYGVLSTEYYDVDIPDNYKDEYIGDGESVGVLLGVNSTKVPSTVKLYAEEVLMISVTLLKLNELEYILDEGSTARKEIVNHLETKGIHNITSIHRDSMI